MSYFNHFLILFLTIGTLLFTNPSLTFAQYSVDSYSDPGYSDPGYGDPGYGDPGYSDPGSSGGGCNPSRLSGRAFNDNNQNGSFDAGDSGIPAVGVKLYSLGMDYITEGVTDGSGNYNIPNVPALGATYNLTYPTPPNATATTSQLVQFQLGCPLHYNFGIYVNQLKQNQPVVASCSINLSWTQYQGASSYKILYTDPDRGGAVSEISHDSSTSKTLTTANGLTGGYRYSFVIAALNNSNPNQIIAYSNNSLWSHQKFGSYTTLPDCTPPTPPALFMPTNKCVNPPVTDDTQITFKFEPNANPPANVITYYLDRNGTQIASIAPSNPWYDVFLSPGESWQYSARVLTTTGNSASSNSFTPTGQNCSTLPPPPPPVLGVDTNTCVDRPGTDDTQVTFSFSPADGPTPNTIVLYRLYRDNVLLAQTGPSNPFIDIFLTPGEPGSYTATIETDTGTSIASNPYSPSPVGQDCSTPTGPGPFFWHNIPTASCAGPNDSRMTVYWRPSAGAIRYQLQPQTNNTSKGNNGWIQPAINIIDPPLVEGVYHEYTFTIPGTVANGEGWEFDITAIDSSNTMTASPNGGSTYYANNWGWVNAFKCTVPDIKLVVTTTTPVSEIFTQYNGSPFKMVTANQNSSVTVNWTVENADSAFTSPNWVQTINLVSKNASDIFTIPTGAQGNSTYRIDASNISGDSFASFQVNVEKFPKPYIQTTGGDIHTNETIYISTP